MNKSRAGLRSLPRIGPTPSWPRRAAGAAGEALLTLAANPFTVAGLGIGVWLIMLGIAVSGILEPVASYYSNIWGLPTPTRLAIQVSAAVQDYWWGVLLAALACSSAIGRRLSAKPRRWRRWRWAGIMMFFGMIVLICVAILMRYMTFFHIPTLVGRS